MNFKQFFLLCLLISLISGATFAQSSFEDRQSLIDQFNKAEEIRSKMQNRIQSLNARDGYNKPEQSTYYFKPNDQLQYKLDIGEADLLKASKKKQKAEALNAVQKMKKIAQGLEVEGIERDEGYFSKLKRAVPCFKRFLSALLRARSERDDEAVKCAVASDKDCVEGAVHEGNKEFVTITDQFYVCLEVDERTMAQLMEKLDELN